MRLLAQFSGDVARLPAAELRALFQARGSPLTTLRETHNFLDAHTDLFLDDAQPLLERLGLTHFAALHLFDGQPGSWSDGARECCFPTGIPFAARHTRVDPETPWSGSEIERDVGALLADGRPVDLEQPRLVARAFLLRDRVYVGQQLWESDAKALRRRHVENRPFFSPVSLEPRFARALINLVQVQPGGTVYDPFCGTGGLLLEAALLGHRAIGSDLDSDMVHGAEKNLAHFGAPGQVFASDVGAAPTFLQAKGLLPVDAVVSDLPYGRSATTGKEDRASLYARAYAAVARVLKLGGLAVLGVPDDASTHPPTPELRRLDVFHVRAHKSLTRHFVLLRREGTV